MLTAYVACLIAGGLLLAVSLLGGGDADGDAAVGADADAGADVDGAADSVEADAETEGAEAEGEGLVAAARFLSLRNLVFFVAFFGLTGTLLTLLKANAALTLVAAVALGGAAAVAVHRLMGYLRRTESGALRSLATLGGARARVLVRLTRAKPGKVTVVTGDGTEQLVARVHERAATDRFEAGDTVVIVRFQDGVALVAETDFLS
jgi:membrane protein implicated in regulation of membrane protease activity